LHGGHGDDVLRDVSGESCTRKDLLEDDRVEVLVLVPEGAVLGDDLHVLADEGIVGRIDVTEWVGIFEELPTEHNNGKQHFGGN